HSHLFQGTVAGECKTYSPVCNTYFNFGDKDHLIGSSGLSSFRISSQSLVYYLTCRSLGYFREAPVLRKNLSLPGVEPAKPQRNLSLPGVEPTEPEQNLPGVRPKQPKDQDQCTAQTIGLVVVGTALLLALAFVCVAGWRTRQAAVSVKGGAASGNSTVSCHDSENSIYGMTEIVPTNT
ncbi:uncharacterized protein LOC119572816, partial [Penaeus monodon]|uniref:uncharacterized protein LOC119572816 n=1 Tax=Penaeus monodon TaxID=6687 RepID=UPI0018A7A15B